MSERKPLEKLDLDQYYRADDEPEPKLSPYNMAQISKALDAAIDRINELEARYAGHVHHYELPDEDGSYTLSTTPPKEASHE